METRKHCHPFVYTKGRAAAPRSTAQQGPVSVQGNPEEGESGQDHFHPSIHPSIHPLTQQESTDTSHTLAIAPGEHAEVNRKKPCPRGASVYLWEADSRRRYYDPKPALPSLPPPPSPDSSSSHSHPVCVCIYPGTYTHTDTPAQLFAVPCCVSNSRVRSVFEGWLTAESLASRTRETGTHMLKEIFPDMRTDGQNPAPAQGAGGRRG